MSIFSSIFKQPARNDWRSWHALWRTIPVLVSIWIFTAKAGRENDAAKRQQTAVGTITDCGSWSKGRTPCHYLFSADDKDYMGADSVESGAYYGHAEVVYYDSRNPVMNSLEDFSESGRRDRNLAYLFVSVFAVMLVVVIYSNTSGEVG